MPPSLLAYASGATDWKCSTNACARWPAWAVSARCPLWSAAQRRSQG